MCTVKAFRRLLKPLCGAAGSSSSGVRSSQAGFSLIEVLLASFIIITVGVGLLAGLTLASRATMNTDNRETARDLAVAQLEYVKAQDYDENHYDYSAALIPQGSPYSVAVVNPPESLEDGNLQKITVIVSRNGHEVVRLSDYKVNW